MLRSENGFSAPSGSDLTSALSVGLTTPAPQAQPRRCIRAEQVRVADVAPHHRRWPVAGGPGNNALLGAVDSRLCAHSGTERMWRDLSLYAAGPGDCFDQSLGNAARRKRLFAQVAMLGDGSEERTLCLAVARCHDPTTGFRRVSPILEEATEKHLSGVTSGNGQNSTLSRSSGRNPPIKRWNGDVEVQGHISGRHTAGQQFSGGFDFTVCHPALAASFAA